MLINGVDIDFSYTDVEHMKRFDSAFEACQKEFNDANDKRKEGGLKASIAAIEEEIKATRAFFDSAVGNGTSEKVFGKSTDSLVYVNAITDFADAIQSKVIEDNDNSQKRYSEMQKRMERFKPQK